jgi:hypothetical protein
MPRFPLRKRPGLGHRRLRPAVPFLIAAATGVFVAALVGLAGSQADNDPPAGQTLPAAVLAPENQDAAPAAGRSHRAWVNVVDAHAPAPRKLRIAAIGVSAKVIPLGLLPDHTMRTPRNVAQAGWYRPGPEPGERGAAVVVGHVDSKRGPGVFYKLRRLRRGNIIKIVRAGGSVVRFRVEGLERWPKTQFPTRRVFRRTRLSALRIVTCSGRFDADTGHYADNTIVYAARVPVRRTVRG